MNEWTVEGRTRLNLLSEREAPSAIEYRISRRTPSHYSSRMAEYLHEKSPWQKGPRMSTNFTTQPPDGSGKMIVARVDLLNEGKCVREKNE